MTTITNKTRPVNCRASGQVGQETFRNSPVVSRKYCCIAFGFLLLSFSAKLNSFLFLTAKTPPWFSGVAFILSCLQARQDLNPQPFVLETNALPIELLAYNK